MIIDSTNLGFFCSGIGFGCLIIVIIKMLEEHRLEKARLEEQAMICESILELSKIKQQRNN